MDTEQIFPATSRFTAWNQPKLWKKNHFYSNLYAEFEYNIKNQLICVQEHVIDAELLFTLTSRFTTGKRIQIWK